MGEERYAVTFRLELAGSAAERSTLETARFIIQEDSRNPQQEDVNITREDDETIDCNTEDADEASEDDETIDDDTPETVKITRLLKKFCSGLGAGATHAAPGGNLVIYIVQGIGTGIKHAYDAKHGRKLNYDEVRRLVKLPRRAAKSLKKTLGNTGRAVMSRLQHGSIIVDVVVKVSDAYGFIGDVDSGKLLDAIQINMENALADCFGEKIDIGEFTSLTVTGVAPFAGTSSDIAAIDKEMDAKLDTLEHLPGKVIESDRYSSVSRDTTMHEFQKESTIDDVKSYLNQLLKNVTEEDAIASKKSFIEKYTAKDKLSNDPPEYSVVVNRVLIHAESPNPEKNWALPMQCNDPPAYSAITSSSTAAGRATEEQLVAVNKVIDIQAGRIHADLSFEGYELVPARTGLTRTGQNPDVYGPIVYPKVSKDKHFFSGRDLADGQYVPEDLEYVATSGPTFLPEADSIRFADVLLKHLGEKFTCIIGDPGSGKTTYGLRLAMRSDEEMKIFHYKMKNWNYDKPLSLKELLVVREFGDEITELEQSQVFEWMKICQEKCIFIFDGLDEVPWPINHNPPTFDDWEDSYPLGTLIGSLVTKPGMFKRSKFIMTSRRHAVSNLQLSIQPDVVLALHDFTYEDAEKLFSSATASDETGEHEASHAWSDLESNSKSLTTLCQNPLMLRLTAEAYLLKQKDGTDANLTSMTSVMHTIFNAFLNSPSCRGLNSNQHQELTPGASDAKLDKLHKLNKVAWNAINAKRLTISATNLKDAGLNADIAQDFVVPALVRHLRNAPLPQPSRSTNESSPDTRQSHSNLLMQGNGKYYFCHKSVMEYLAASEVVLDKDKCSHYLEEFIEDDDWLMVRRFVYGIMIGGEEGSEDDRKTLRQKLKIMWSQLVRGQRNCEREAFLWVLCDVFECQSDNLVQELVPSFPAEVDLRGVAVAQSAANALAYVIERVSITITKLDLDNCKLDWRSLDYIFDAIQRMPGKVDTLIINNNNLDNNEAINNLSKVVENVRCTLKVWNCFKDSEGKRYQPANAAQQATLQAMLNGSNNTSLELWFTRQKKLQKNA